MTHGARASAACGRGDAREAATALCVVGSAPPPGAAAEPGRRDFAILVPAYEEVDNVDALYAAFRAAFDAHGLDGEVVFVDDGSHDGTYAAACRAAVASELRGTVLRHRVNRGKTQALLTAAAATDATYVIPFDADLQYAPAEIPHLLARLDDGWDIVAGRKVGVYEKRWVSRIYNGLAVRLFGVPARDLNGLKALRREVLYAVPLRHDWHRLLVVLAHARGYTVTEMEVALHPRRAGSSKFAGHGRILVGVADLLVVWFYLRFAAKPMQFFGGAGVLLGSAGVFLGAVAIALRALHVGPPPVGYRPLLELVVLLVVLGAMLVGVGFLAEMIAILRDDVETLRRERGREGVSR